jgi:hypothetical protein
MKSLARRNVLTLKLLRVWLMLPLAIGAACGADAATTASSLQTCAAIGDPTARLACYDKLAGVTAAPAPASAAPTPLAPAAAPAAAAAVAAPAAPATVPAPLPKETFGLYEAEHPALTTARTGQASVVGLGSSASGRMTVSLDGEGLWELLDGGDALLAVGDAVTIRRAALGSYLMETPSKRTHRVHRLH